MNLRNKFLGAVALTFLVLSGCAIPGLMIPQGKQAVGYGKVALSWNDEAALGRTVQANLSQILDDCKVTLISHDGYASQVFTMTTSAHTFDSVEAGTWDISLDGSKAGVHYPVITLTSKVVAEGATLTIDLDIRDFLPVSGNGDFSLTIVVPYSISDAQAIVVNQAEVQQGGILHPVLSASAVGKALIRGGGSNQETTFSMTGLPAGAYDLLITLKEGADVAGIFRETVNIWPGLTSNKWIDSTGTLADYRQFFTTDLLGSNDYLWGLWIYDASSNIVALTGNFASTTTVYTIPATENLSTFTFKPTRQLAGQRVEWKLGSGSFADIAAAPASPASPTQTLTAGNNVLTVRVHSPSRAKYRDYTVTIDSPAALVHRFEFEDGISGGQVALSDTIAAGNTSTNIHIPDMQDVSTQNLLKNATADNIPLASGYGPVGSPNGNKYFYSAHKGEHSSTYPYAHVTTNLDLSGSFTFSAWVRPRLATNNATTMTLLSTQVVDTSAIDTEANSEAKRSGISIGINSAGTGDGKLLVTAGDGTNTGGGKTIGAAVTFDTWQLVTVTVDAVAQNQHIYVNGFEVTQSTSQLPTIPGGIQVARLGARADAAAPANLDTGLFPYGGALDDVRIYSGAMTAAQVSTLYYGYPDNVTLSYHANGGAFEAQIADRTYFVGNQLTLSSVTPTRSGYSFAHWTEDIGGSGTPYASSAAYTIPSGAANLYAQWDVANWTITFNANGGVNPPAAQNIQQGQSANLTLISGLSRDGYYFTGWNTDQFGGGTAYNDGDLITPPADQTLYAQWAALYASGNFLSNGNFESVVAYTANVGTLPYWTGSGTSSVVDLADTTLDGGNGLYLTTVAELVHGGSQAVQTHYGTGTLENVADIGYAGYSSTALANTNSKVEFTIYAISSQVAGDPYTCEVWLEDSGGNEIAGSRVSSSGTTTASWSKISLTITGSASYNPVRYVHVKVTGHDLGGPTENWSLFAGTVFDDSSLIITTVEQPSPV